MDSWKRLIELMKSNLALNQEAKEAMSSYDDGLHELTHHFLENAFQNGVQCGQVKDFLHGLLRLGYIRARVGSLDDDGVPPVEKGLGEGDNVMDNDTLSRLLKDIDIDL